MGQAAAILVCFAVEEERKFFQAFARSHACIQTLVTGMGPRNAERAFRVGIERSRPDLVLSCGFAGGLNPDFATGDIVFSADTVPAVAKALLASGARPARFYGAERVASTAEQKRALREATGADAVEMESHVICRICGELSVANAIVRVILDTASEDLPLDFNLLMTPDQRISMAKLLLWLARSPGRISALLALQRQSRAAARRLADVLSVVIPP